MAERSHPPALDRGGQGRPGDRGSLLLGGSRGAGADDANSDYDLAWVLADRACDQRAEGGRSTHISYDPEQPLLDISYTCRERADRGAGQLGAGRLCDGVGVYDKSGQVAQVLEVMVTMPRRARADVLGWFDAYINAFYRSLKGLAARQPARRAAAGRRVGFSPDTRALRAGAALAALPRSPGGAARHAGWPGLAAGISARHAAPPRADGRPTLQQELRLGPRRFYASVGSTRYVGWRDRAREGVSLRVERRIFAQPGHALSF